MMETKLWTVLCALLLILNLGSADHDDGHAAAATESAGGAEVGGREPPPAEPVPASRLGHSSHAAPALNGSDTNRSSNGTSSLSSNTTKVGETISQMNEPTKENETSVVLPSVSVVPQTTVNPTEASEPRILPPESHATTSHIPPATTTSITSPPHTAQNAPVDTPITNTSNHSAPLPPHSTSTSQQPTHPNIHASTSAPTAKPETTTTTSTQSSSTSSTSSSQEPHNSVSQTLTSPHTSQSEGPRDLPKSTVTPPSNISAQSKAHADSPSQLNVGGDTTMIHESPTLDPLLAGLVSAFIITAVIITLLLFLKLRRRDSRPEFRRLQDLPMDDMMEDTPLSMYSY